MSVIGFDLGMRFGFSIRSDSGIHVSGFRILKNSKTDHEGKRFADWSSILADIFDTASPSCVFYERVYRHFGNEAAQVYGGLRFILLGLAASRGIEAVGLPVKSIKKHATGTGNAQKEDMIRAARTRWPGENLTDDNEVDARWIAEYGVSLSKGDSRCKKK